MERVFRRWRFGCYDADALKFTDVQVTYYGVAVLLLATFLVLYLVKPRKRQTLNRPRSPDLEKRGLIKATDRLPGEWHPVEFKRPAPQPYPDWDLRTTKPLPYRPFKYGKYHITMGLRTMKWDEWIELDNQFPAFHTDKARRIEERGSKCCKTAPEAFDGVLELLEELYVLNS